MGIDYSHRGAATLFLGDIVDSLYFLTKRPPGQYIRFSAMSFDCLPPFASYLAFSRTGLMKKHRCKANSAAREKFWVELIACNFVTLLY
jgi:hypothetical protein